MAYAIIVDGAPVEVPTGVPFWTSQLKITTPEEAAWSGWPIGSVIDKVYNHSAEALANFTDDDRARYAIHTFALPAPPAGKVLAAYTLALDGDSIVVTPTFADPPVPAQVSRLQAKQALRIAGNLDAVETAIAAASKEVQIYWADAPIFHRDHPTLLSMATAVQMSSDQVDALFRAAILIT